MKNAFVQYPTYFQPKATHDLVRIGSATDGGYVVPKRVIPASKGLLSFGLNDDCSFEASFSEQANCPVVCFDHTVDTRFWIARIANNAVKALLQLEPSRLLYSSRYLKHRRLFDGRRNRHIQMPIGYGSSGSCTFLQAMDIAKFDGPFFLKIDIEGWEYRILDDLVLNASQMTGLGIELHDIDLHEARIERFINQISEKMALVHFHPNTGMLVGREGRSIIAELTFLSRSLLHKDEVLTTIPLPISGIDAPNTPDSQDSPIKFQ